ncbi:MAG: hypothetical protein WCL04_09245 [Verrucomicrobiota bacterium]
MHPALLLLADVNPHELNGLVILHLFAMLVLVGTTFYACAGAPETRRKVLMWSGIASLLVLLTGGRMWMVLKPTFQQQGWLVVKLVCWLGLSAFAGLAYRRREKACLWIALTLALALTAIAMVRVKPF